MSMTSRLRTEQGMTLIELLIAMVVIAVGVTALVAGLGAGILAVQRSATTSTAGALADQQVEAYRQLSFLSVATDTTTTGSADATYKGDAAYNNTWKITATCPGVQTTAPYFYCAPTRTATGSNGATYRIDSYVSWACPFAGATLGGTLAAPTCTGSAANGAVKQVTVVVRDGSNNSRLLVRVTTTIDSLTG
jgi:prepilin-type N-terminal cleavage/methylation domain-containing protein